MPVRENILIVDDDENLLSGLRRQLRGHFRTETAVGGAAALDALAQKGAFAVVVSDMRMPGMTGVEVLEAFKERSPETVRMMLTGNADQDTAVSAINAGSIFRFFTKPCSTEDLIDGISAGVRQFRLQTAEKELLEHTLAGSLKLLSDLMAFLDPHMTRDVAHMRAWGRLLAGELDIPRAWEIDFACMLAPLGRISVPPDVIAKLDRGEDLNAEETEIVRQVPEIGRRLVSNIPRLGAVADAIFYQDKNFDGGGFPADDVAGTDIPLGGRVLRVLKDVARADPPTAATIDRMAAREGVYDPDILESMKPALDLFAGQDAAQMREVERTLPIALLREGHRLVDDLSYADGRLLLAKNTVLTEMQVNRLRALAKMQSLEEPVSVVMQVGARASA